MCINIGTNNGSEKLWTKNKSTESSSKLVQAVYIYIYFVRLCLYLDFKYMGYRISEYGSDLEDKSQTYNKIKWDVRRHFGKQMNKETKLRIHSITFKQHWNLEVKLEYWRKERNNV